MINNNGYNTYQNNAVLTASPQELTLMLYNGAIKFCNLAVKAIEEKDVETAHANIIKVQNIIQEFQSTLDKKYPVAKSMELIYDYIYNRLLEANMHKDIEILEEVLGYLRELRDTWKEAMKMAKKPKNNATSINGEAILSSL